MDGFLKQSTSVTIKFGPAIDATDGVTPEAGIAAALDNATTGIRLSKNGANMVDRNDATVPTHDEIGWYNVVLDATDTNTVGVLQLMFSGPSVNAPIWKSYYVLEENIYEALFATGSAAFDASDQVTVGGFAAGAITAASIAAAALNGKGDWNVGKTGYRLSATGVDDILDEVIDGANHTTVNSLGRRIKDLQEFGVYEDGAIWIDTVNGSAGTTDYESGTVFNPVDNIADANTLAASLGISRFRIAPNSSITFAANQLNQEFIGKEWTLALGGQNIGGSYFEGASVSGTGTGAGSNFEYCSIGNVTIPDGRMGFCRFTGTVTLSAASDYYFHDCYSGVAGAGTPTIDFGAAVANTNLSIRRYSGGITINNKNNTGTDQMSLEGDGQLVVAASSSGAISLRGSWAVTNTGGATITYDDVSQDVQDILDDTGTSGVIVASINSNAITAAVIATGAIDADAIATDAIDSTKIAAGAITSSELAANAIGATQIANGAIDAATFAAGAIDAAAIATGAIDADAIAAGSITSAKFAAGAITASVVATDAIDADAIATDGVNEIRDAVWAKSLTQPGQEAPAANQTAEKAVAYLYKAWRNRSTVDASEYLLYNDDGTTVDQKAPVSDSGTVGETSEVVSGP